MGASAIYRSAYARKNNKECYKTIIYDKEYLVFVYDVTM